MEISLRYGLFKTLCNIHSTLCFLRWILTKIEYLDQNARTQESRNASTSPPPDKTPKPAQNDNSQQPSKPSSPRPISPHRPGFTRTTSSAEKTPTLNGTMPKSVSPSPNSRRNSWLSSISSKFSSSPGAHIPPATPSPPAAQVVPVPPGPNAPRNSSLQHGTKAAGDEPYTPAPPKSAQPSFLQSALRRLSSSGGQISAPMKGHQHGLCERKVLNVDRNRERCNFRARSSEVTEGGILC